MPETYQQLEPERMTIRDEFAKAAMQAEITRTTYDDGYDYRAVAICAYKMADAMLQARKDGG